MTNQNYTVSLRHKPINKIQMHYSPRQFKTTVNFLVETTLHRELSFYQSKYQELNPTIEIHHDEVTDGFLVWFRVDGVVRQQFEYLNGKHDELEAHVREALCRLLDFHN